MTPTFTIVSRTRKVEFQMDIDLKRPVEGDLWSYAARGLLPEPEVIEVMMRALRPGDVAADCGACVGFFTLLMAALVAPDGVVHAFEPGPANSARLQGNYILNEDRKLALVTAHSQPLWSRAEEVGLFLHPNSGQHSLARMDKCVGQMQVPATTLDLALSTVPRLVKLDVEGAEQRVLEGADQMLASHPPYIIAELNEPALKRLDCSQESLRELMLDYGYETFLLGGDALPSHVPRSTTIVPQRVATMLLYATVEDVGALWPEVRV
jgi:FkbM family methyltransferase